MKLNRKIVTVVSAAGLSMTGLLVSAPAAFADGKVSNANGGATAQFKDYGDKMVLCDTRADGNYVYYTFRLYDRASGDSLRTGKKENHAGNGHCVTFDYNFPQSSYLCYRSYISDRFFDTTGNIVCAGSDGRSVPGNPNT